MDQLLGLYTSPNSLQLPPGATLRADNVYLDTDGYFKPFKKIEKAFADSVLIGNGGVLASLWSDGTDENNFVLFNVRGVLLLVPTLIYSGANVGNLIGSRYYLDNVVDSATRFFQFTSNDLGLLYGDYTGDTNPHIPFYEVGSLYALGISSIQEDAPGVIAYAIGTLGSDQSVTENSVASPAPQVYAATYAQPSTYVTDGDPSITGDRYYANAYRFTSSIKVGGYLIESRPTGSVYVRGQNRNTSPGIWISQINLRLWGGGANAVDLGSEFKINVYRTPLEITEDLTALVPRESDDQRLVSATSYSTPSTLSFVDQIPMPPGSAELYTNETQDGIIKQNEPPPLHKTSALYKGYTFFGNTYSKKFVTLDVKQATTGTFNGFWYIVDEDDNITAPVSYSINFASSGNDTNFTTGVFYGTGGAGVDGVLNNFSGSIAEAYYATHLNTSGTGASIFLQAKRFSTEMTFYDVANAEISGTYAHNTVCEITAVAHGLNIGDEVIITLLTGTLAGLTEKRTILTVPTANTFTVARWTPLAAVSTGNASVFPTKISGTYTAGSGIFTNLKSDTSNTFPPSYLDADKTDEANAIYYSKFQQPFSCTIDQKYLVGSDAPILYLANLREYLLIFKEDGVYILRGENEDAFTIDPLYPQLQLTDTKAIQVIDDFVIGLFTVGVVKMNENGYEIISQPIRDDITRMVKGLAVDGTALTDPPVSFYHKANRLFMIGRERALVVPEETPTKNGDMFDNYYAHLAYCYHIDSKQWTMSTRINLDGAVNIGNDIYFPAHTTVERENPAVTPPDGGAPVVAQFYWDIYRTSNDETNAEYAYTKDFAIRFVKRMMTEDGKGGHFRYLKLYFREMNLTSLTVRYYNNYDFSDNSEYYETTYSDIVTFTDDGSAAYSRSVAYLMIPMEVARGEWLSFEIFNAVSSEVDVIKYNGILLEGVEMVTTPGKSVTI